MQCLSQQCNQFIDLAKIEQTCPSKHALQQINKNEHSNLTETCIRCFISPIKRNCGAFTCQICKYSLCEYCLYSTMARDVCLKYHYLQYLPASYDKIVQGKIQCDQCQQLANYTQKGTYHCFICDFDRCGDCYQQMESIIVPTKCKNGDSVILVPKNDQIINQYKCDVCKIKIIDKGCGTYHCFNCDFDICEYCQQNKIITLHICKSGHRLQLLDRSNSNINNYKCDICKGHLKDKICRTYHCFQCDYDRCEECFLKYII